MTDTTRADKQVIAVLPPHLIDQIAAGEVIERPASVAKELIENAIDAAATRIDIEIEGAGSTQIRVVDNGGGMAPGDVAEAITRHATSKIQTLDDLSSILTFGFRGEALAAISSVSHVEIVSRTQGRDAATMMFWEGGTLTEEGETGARVGTAITVRHLFFNTPARREYLRAPTTESKRIIETVTDFACFHHRIGFSLTMDGRSVLSLAPAEEMRNRLVDLYGAKIAELQIAYASGDAELRVSGFAGKPELARGTRDRILVYVNGRRVWSQALAHAATAAYGETIPRGRFPFAIVCVGINPHRVDVNVHPAKREVRFAKARTVYDLTYYAINKAIFASGRAAPEMRLNAGEQEQPTTSERLPFQSPPATSGVGADSPPVSGLPAGDVGALSGGEVPRIGPGSSPSPPSPAVPARAAAYAEGAGNLWQFNDVYIVTVVGEELWVIDQHTAHERIQYEQILRRLRDRSADSQQLLFAESIELEPQVWAVYEQSQDLFASLGFHTRPFGRRTVLLEGVPTGLRIKNPVTLFRRVLEDVEVAQRAGLDLQKAAAASTACRASVMAGDRLKPAEMQALFANLMHTENPFSCPHGRPTMVKIPIADFDRKFCRK